MSNKTGVLSFDELARFHGLSLMKWDEDNYVSENTQLAKDFFEAGQQSKQAEIDELHVANVNLMRIKKKLIERNEDMFKQILKRENCNLQLKSEIDELKKRIDKAVDHIEEWYGVVELSMIVDILKGDQP